MTVSFRPLIRSALLAAATAGMLLAMQASALRDCHPAGVGAM